MIINVVPQLSWRELAVLVLVARGTVERDSNSGVYVPSATLRRRGYPPAWSSETQSTLEEVSRRKLIFNSASLIDVFLTVRGEDALRVGLAGWQRESVARDALATGGGSWKAQW